MEINREEMAAKAAEVTGQAKDLLSKVDTDKAMGATNKFMAGVFKFGKIASALFMLLCIATMVLSALYALFKGAESLKAPDFKDVAAALDADGGGGGDSDTAELARKQEYRKVRDRYRKQIDTIVDLYRLDAKGDTEFLVGVLCEMPEKVRSSFVKGALSFGKDAKKYFAKKDNGTQVDLDELFLYCNLFEQAEKLAEESKEEARMDRQAAWTICGGAFLGLILFLFLPLLIQIEENTRK